MSCLTTLLIATVLLPHIGLCAVLTLRSYYDVLLSYSSYKTADKERSKSQRKYGRF